MTAPSLYLLTNHEPLEVLLPKLELVFSAKLTSLLQIRRKITPSSAYTKPPSQCSSERLAEAKTIKQLADDWGVATIVNDDAMLAKQLGCGVHLGQDDGDIQAARSLLGAHAIIGSTCHDSLELARFAQLQGASYAAFGALHPSTSKADTARVSLAQIGQAVRDLTVPVCAIGGITPNDLAGLTQAGVSLIAVIGSLLGGSMDDVKQHIDAWHNCFATQIRS